MWRQKFRKLSSLPRSELIDLLTAQRELLAAQLLVWSRPVGRLVDARERGGPSAPTGDSTAAARAALAIGRAAENGVFRPKCLVRAVALNRLLEKRAIPGSRIRVGVRRGSGGFAAHAWVEYDGEVLDDLPEHIGSFTELTEIALRPRG